ncbi:MAG: hypothetical protein ACRDFX_07920, partial [Chloroflexota bacterium]
SEVAARIWGSAEAIREKIGQPLPPSEEETRRKFSEGALADCGEVEFRAAWAHGRSVDEIEAYRYALEQFGAGDAPAS